MAWAGQDNCERLGRNCKNLGLYFPIREPIVKNKPRKKKKKKTQGSWPSQSEKRAAVDLGVIGSSPTLGIEITNETLGDW